MLLLCWQHFIEGKHNVISTKKRIERKKRRANFHKSSTKLLKSISHTHTHTKWKKVEWKNSNFNKSSLNLQPLKALLPLIASFLLPTCNKRRPFISLTCSILLSLKFICIIFYFFFLLVLVVAIVIVISGNLCAAPLCVSVRRHCCHSKLHIYLLHSIHGPLAAADWLPAHCNISCMQHRLIA